MPANETPTDPLAPPQSTSPATNGAATPPETQHHLTPAQPIPLRVRAGRFGELDHSELVHLLDSFDSERERARFRESLYISFFICVCIAWFVFYGPRFLWHQPKLISPTDILRDRELTQLAAPELAHVPTPALKNSKPAPKPTIDNKTMETLKANAPKPAAPAQPLPSAPQPTNPAQAPPPPPTPTPSPRTPPPVVADAPSVQPTRPNFGSGTPSASNAMRDALNGAARDHGSSRDSGGGPIGRSPLNLGGTEILSDTQGVDFDPYLRRILSDIKRNWLPLIPQETLPPLSKEGQAFIRFKINPDGSIGGMWLDGSTHDEAINRSCWGSITSEGQFPPLPSQFHGPNLELRIHYIVSQRPIE